MRKIMIILFLLSTYYLIQAQETIPKKANTITIFDSTSVENYWISITNILFENGYGILTSDKESGTIITSEKPFKNGAVKLNIIIHNQKVLIRGDFKANISIDFGGVTAEAGWMMIEFTGSKNSAYRNAWEEMNKIAQQLPGQKEYLIK